jgi:putative protease
MKKKPELVLPGGDLERAIIALDFGADAVYVGLNKYSLRKGEVRFDIPDIKKVIDYAHSLGKKTYVTFNIFAHNEHLESLRIDMAEIARFGPDAFIVADIGVIQIAKQVAPNIPIHISTQANTTNIEDVRFWQSIGVKRVVLARELTLEEISEINKAVPNIELEVFAHGSMCISYSGRCLLSNYVTGRHANLGDCAQPCRWNYRVARVTSYDSRVTSNNQNSQLKTDSKLINHNSRFFLEESQRPGEFFEIEESENGTNIMSSRDLRTVQYLDKMLAAGITGFKVEGRNKTEYYLAATALAYREGLDLAYRNKYGEDDKKRLSGDLEKIAHRGYSSGFLFGDAKKGETYEGRSPIENYRYIGIVAKNLKHQNGNYCEISVKNKIQKNMAVEVLTPEGVKKDKILDVIVDNQSTGEINPGKTDQTALIRLNKKYPINSLIRTRKG